MIPEYDHALYLVFSSIKDAHKGHANQILSLYAASRVSRQFRQIVCDVLRWRPRHVIDVEDDNEPPFKRCKTEGTKELMRRKLCQPEPIKVSERLFEFYACTELSLSCLMTVIEENRPCIINSGDMFRVGQAGSMELIEMICQHDSLTWHSWIRLNKGAAAANRVDLIKWIHLHGMYDDIACATSAFQYGSADVLAFLEGPSVLHVRRYAARSGQVAWMRYIDSKFPEGRWHGIDFFEAFMSCSTEAIQYIISVQETISVRDIALDRCVRHGAFKRVGGCDEKFFDLFAHHIWPFDEGWKMTLRVARQAAKSGNVSTFALLCEMWELSVEEMTLLLWYAVRKNDVAMAKRILAEGGQVTAGAWECVVLYEDTAMADCLFEASGNKIDDDHARALAHAAIRKLAPARFYFWMLDHGVTMEHDHLGSAVASGNCIFLDIMKATGHTCDLFGGCKNSLLALPTEVVLGEERHLTAFKKWIELGEMPSVRKEQWTLEDFRRDREGFLRPMTVRDRLWLAAMLATMSKQMSKPCVKVVTIKFLVKHEIFPDTDHVCMALMKYICHLRFDMTRFLDTFDYLRERKVCANKPDHKCLLRCLHLDQTAHLIASQMRTIKADVEIEHPKVNRCLLRVD